MPLPRYNSADAAAAAFEELRQREQAAREAVLGPKGAIRRDTVHEAITLLTEWRISRVCTPGQQTRVIHVRPYLQNALAQRTDGKHDDPVLLHREHMREVYALLGEYRRAKGCPLPRRVDDCSIAVSLAIAKTGPL